MQVFVGPVIELRAIAKIGSGAEITISYIDLAATQAERRHVLLDRYHFDIGGGGRGDADGGQSTSRVGAVAVERDCGGSGGAARVELRLHGSDRADPAAGGRAVAADQQPPPAAADTTAATARREDELLSDARIRLDGGEHLRSPCHALFMWHMYGLSTNMITLIASNCG